MFSLVATSLPDNRRSFFARRPAALPPAISNAQPRRTDFLSSIPRLERKERKLNRRFPRRGRETLFLSLAIGTLERSLADRESGLTIKAFGF